MLWDRSTELLYFRALSSSPCHTQTSMTHKTVWCARNKQEQRAQFLQQNCGQPLFRTTHHRVIIKRTRPQSLSKRSQWRMRKWVDRAGCAVWHCKLQSQKLGFQVRKIMRSRPGQPELHSKALSQKPKSGLGVWCMSGMCEGLFLVPRIKSWMRSGYTYSHKLSP